MAARVGGGHFLVKAFVADDHGGGIELPGLLDEQAAVAVGREELHFEQVGMLADDVEGLGADGSGGSQDGDPSFGRCFHQNVR